MLETEKNLLVDFLLKEFAKLLESEIVVFSGSFEDTIDVDFDMILNHLMKKLAKSDVDKIFVVGGLMELKMIAKFISIGVKKDFLFIPNAFLPIGSIRLGLFSVQTMFLDFILFFKAYVNQNGFCVTLEFKRDSYPFLATCKMLREIGTLKIEEKKVQLRIDSANVNRDRHEKIVKFDVLPWIPLQEDIRFAKNLAREIFQHFSKSSGNYCLVYDHGFRFVPFEMVLNTVDEISSCFQEVTL